MAVTRSSITSVLADMHAARDQLRQNLDDLDRSIACLERMYPTPSKEAPPTELRIPTTEAGPHQQGTAAPIKTASGKEDLRPIKRATVPGIGLTEAIAKAAEEARHNQTEMVRRVVELRPGTTTNVAGTQVSVMLKNRLLHKGPDLIIRRVVDRKIQKLPVSKGEDGSLAAYVQYSSGAKE